MTDVYPDITLHPYYIVAPPYSRFSAGIKVLHLLCHALNRRGYQAYMLILPDMPATLDVTNPDLLTPRLTQGIIDAHKAAKRTPITIYPETVCGNPLKAPVVARYLLNVSGLLGGSETVAGDEIVFPYSDALALTPAQKANVLFLPVSDTRVFRPPPAGSRRQGSAYYAMKYKQRYPGAFVPPEPDSIEINFSQTPEEMAQIFQRVEKLYCYEATSTALDAGLCGCPVISLPNDHLTAKIGATEMSLNGHAWGDTPEEFARAKATVGLVAKHFQEALERFNSQLERFVAITQNRAAEVAYTAALRSPLRRPRPVPMFPAIVAASVRGSFWRGEAASIVPNGLTLLRRRGLAGVLYRLKHGTVGREDTPGPVPPGDRR
jgi:hypothetical protein